MLVMFLFGLINKNSKIEFEFLSPYYLNYFNNHCSLLFAAIIYMRDCSYLIHIFLKFVGFISMQYKPKNNAWIYPILTFTLIKANHLV